jgi:hypothetical protein
MATKTSTDTNTGWLEATETFLFVLDARQPEYRVEVVRDRRTGKLAEVPLTEFPPLHEGSEGRVFLVTKGELYLPTEEVVQHKPQHFRPTTRTP